MTKFYHIFLGQGFKKNRQFKGIANGFPCPVSFKTKKNALLNYAYRNKNGSFSSQSSP